MFMECWTGKIRDINLCSLSLFIQSDDTEQLALLFILLPKATVLDESNTKRHFCEDVFSYSEF